MRRLSYSQPQREEALSIAKRRLELVEQFSRRDDFIGPMLPSHWIGALAEVVCRDLYPELKQGGPEVSDGALGFIEFKMGGYVVEVKCTQSHQAKVGEYLPINITKFRRRKGDYDILYGYLMKKHPSQTSTIWELGYIWTEDINATDIVEMTYSPAIAIPWADFRPIEKLEL